MTYEHLIVNKDHEKFIALIQLNRPKELNALNRKLMTELKEAISSLDQDDSVRVIIITGNEKAFAAGADITEMAGKGAVDMLQDDQFSRWESIRRTKKPLIAAVSGFALGGGCELCMLCDMIVASDTAKFGQPEIKIGVMPGAGGTQRLTKAIGKALAMEVILTGRFLSAEEALKAGLVNRVVPVELYLDEATKLASSVAEMSPLAARLAKESVLKSLEANLDEGLAFERKNFYLLFSSNDQKEGMQAFVEKRKPDFKGT